MTYFQARTHPLHIRCKAHSFEQLNVEEYRNQTEQMLCFELRMLTMLPFLRRQMRTVWFPKFSDGCLWCFDTGWQSGGQQGHNSSDRTWRKWRNSADFHSLLRCEEMWAKVWLVRWSAPPRHGGSLTQGGLITAPPPPHTHTHQPLLLLSINMALQAPRADPPPPQSSVHSCRQMGRERDSSHAPALQLGNT